jgi:hypothetical protein
MVRIYIKIISSVIVFFITLLATSSYISSFGLEEPAQVMFSESSELATPEPTKVPCPKAPITWDLTEVAVQSPPSMKFSWESQISIDDLSNLGLHPIVKIIHQSYKTKNLTGSFKTFNDIWKKTHPDYTHLLWTDDDNRLLVYKYYRWFLPVYDMMPRKIMRIDIVRCLYLHKFGGLYTDLDVFPSKSNTPLFVIPVTKNVVLGKITEDNDWEHNIPNAWMYSKPRSEFWMMAVNLATQRAFSHCEGAEIVTGPVMIFDAVKLYTKIYGSDNDVKVLDPGLVYGVDWRVGSKSCVRFSKVEYDACFEEYPNCYAITVWTHSWE